MTEMCAVDHTDPHTDEPFLITYRRGVVMAADGGRAGDDRTTVGSDRPTTMADVEHESPTDGPSRTFERGLEGNEGSV